MLSNALLSLSGLLGLFVGAGPSHDGHDHGKESGAIYTLDTCAVTGKKLTADAVAYNYKGRELRFFCKECPAKFEKDPESYLKKVDEKIVEQQLPLYPLDICIVSKEKLGGEMGEPINYVYNNRLVRFCCKGCTKDFTKKPEEFLSKLDQAVIEKQKASYPLETCLVSGEKLGSMGAPVEYVFGTRLIRFCCKSCVKDFSKEPSKHTAKLDAAAKAKEKH